MTDLLTYFRIEARELVDELSGALSELARGVPAAGPAGIALRHAHTLKGAARVVGQTGMADRVHELEELLGPFRNVAGPVPAPELARLQSLADQLSDDLAGLGEDSGPTPTPAPGPTPLPPPAAGIPVPRPQTPQPPPETPSPPPETPSPPVESPVSDAAIEVSRADEVVSTAQTARASLQEIDSLINGVSQTRAQLGSVRDSARRARRLRAAVDGAGRLSEAQVNELGELARLLENSAERVDRELREVYTTAERLRLIPVESIVPDLERGVRDVTAAQGKQARLEVSGARIALDATILAGAHTALRQIVRNAVAHGVETPDERRAAGKDVVGQVRVEVTHGAVGVRFRCTDDGRGIDLAAVRRKLVQAGRAPDESIDDAQTLGLLLGSGISTATTVSEISGHGIGLDVVQDVVQRIGGRLEMSTTPGRGTTIDLVTPASMTAQEVVLVRAGARLDDEPDDAGALIALPLRQVRQARRVGGEDFAGELAIWHQGHRIPYVPLPDVLGRPEDPVVSERPGRTVLVLDGRDGPVAIGVSRLVGTAEVAVRPLPPLAPVPPLLCGIWIDIDGRPRPVLDPGELAAAATSRRVPLSRATGVLSSGTVIASGQAVSAVATAHPEQTVILIVDDSLTTRMLERSILQAAGYQVEEAGSAEEGLAMATRKHYAVAVVDVEMPGMNGFAFIEQTRSRPELRHLPCILVTTKASPADRERGRAAGARGHIDKGDFHQDRLLDLITGLLAEGVS